MSSVGYFFSYVNDARSQEPEACQSQSAVSKHNKLISSHSELAQPPTAHVQQTHTRTHTQSPSIPSGSGSSRGPLCAHVTQLTALYSLDTAICLLAQRHSLLPSLCSYHLCPFPPSAGYLLPVFDLQACFILNHSSKIST